ncbi:MAG: energy transducer TonB [Verrucomicrobiota bacterium]
MKYLKKLTALAALTAFAGASYVSAQSQEPLDRTYTLPDFTVEGVSSPVLESYSTPRIPASKVGMQVTMYYTIDKKGNVRSIRSNTGPFSDQARADLAVTMTQMLRKWKFEPATSSGGYPVAIKVSMPVKVTSPGTASNNYASISVKDMKLVPKAG